MLLGKLKKEKKKRWRGGEESVISIKEQSATVTVRRAEAAKGVKATRTNTAKCVGSTILIIPSFALPRLVITPLAATQFCDESVDMLGLK